MTAKMRIICALSLLFSMALASCGQNSAIAAPPLYAPAALQPDSALVTRGTIESLVVMPGLTRLPTDAARLEYGSGRISSIYAWPGDSVVEGQLLARLDASHLESQIENMEELILRSRTFHRMQSDEMALQIEYSELAYAQYPSQSLRERIEWLKLDLNHLEIRHVLDMADLESNLANLLEGLGGMEIRAPFDGDIVYTLGLGTWVNVNDPVMYIARPDGVFVEYIGVALPTVRLRHGVRTQGVINGRSFDIELMPITLEEQIHHNRLGVAPPIRFEILAEPDDLPSHGKSVFIRFYTAWVDDALRIPGNALFRNWPYDNYVYRFEDGQQVRVYVTTGVITKSYIEILEGLNEGDEVFVRP